MASRLTEHKPLLWQLYIEKSLTAKQIAKYMQEEHQLKHSEGVYQRAFKKWNFKKYCDGRDWIWVDKKQRGRKVLGKETRFTFNDQIMDDVKIRKEISRHVTTIQQMTTVTTPGTPSGWAAITPDTSTPAYKPPGSHTPHGKSPVNQEANADILSVADSSYQGPATDTNLARQSNVETQIKILVQTMRECGTFIETWDGLYLRTTSTATMMSSYLDAEYLDAAKNIVSAQPRPSFTSVGGYIPGLRILRMTFFNDYLELDQFLRVTRRKIDDVLRTTLFYTCKDNQHQAASVLLSHGVESNSKDTSGDPCLTVASRNNLNQKVRLLIDFGADVEAKDCAGKTSWSHVCGLQSHDLAALILQKANVENNVNRKDGYNPLYRASVDRHVDQAPAELNPIADQNKTPLDMVSDKRDTTGIRRLLINHSIQKASQMRHDRRSASAPHTHAEEPFSSPYPYSRSIWSSESPNPFYSAQSPQPRRVSSFQTSKLASLPDTELQAWASPQMPEPMM